MKQQFNVRKYPLKVVEHGKVITLQGEGTSYCKCGVCGFVKPKSDFAISSPVFNYYICNCCSSLSKDEIETIRLKKSKNYGSLIDETTIYNDACEFTKVSELIKKLSKLPPDARICISYYDSEDGDQITDFGTPEKIEFSFPTEVEIFKI